jgi:Ca2+-binding RTX toxin-like protein
MRTRQLLVAAALFIGTSGAAALPAHAGALPARPGAVFGSMDGFIDYFIAVGTDPEKSGSRSSTNPTTFNSSLNPARLVTSAGSAKAKVSQKTEVRLGAGNSTDGFLFDGVRASSEGFGTTHHNSGAPVPVSAVDSDLDIDFSVELGATFELFATVSAQNSDSDDCSSSEVALDGATTIFRRYDQAGGDCGTTSPNIGAPSGRLAAGDYTLSASLETSMASEDDGNTTSSTSKWSVTLRVFPACSVEGDSGNNVLTGTAGNDVICGLGGADTLNGLGGRDVLIGGPGRDTENGGPGADRIFGDAGNDTAHGGGSADLIEGGDGEDDIFGDAGSDKGGGVLPPAGLFGGNGGDTVSGGTGEDAADGGTGRDTMRGGDDDDVMTGGADANKLFGDKGDDSLFGGPTDDRLEGGSGDDLLKPGGGADTGLGKGGDDEIIGDAGDDTLSGDAGKDKVLGGDGRDHLFGGTQHDVLRGGDNNDTLRAKDQTNDIVDGGHGHDKASYDRHGVDDVISIEEQI